MIQRGGQIQVGVVEVVVVVVVVEGIEKVMEVKD